MQKEKITVNRARTHNLKNISVELPRNAFNVITGMSGSGKSSLAFDTIYAEGQRRYVESLSAYARQFLSLMDKPDVDSIEGLSPAISINQKAARFTPRSTVGTVTEIYDYLRLLFARVGEPRCPEHQLVLSAKTIGEIVDQILQRPPDAKIALLAPVVRDRKGEFESKIASLRKSGFVRLRINGKIYEIEQLPQLNRNVRHTIDVVVDRLIISDQIRQRLTESVEIATDLADGLLSCCEILENGEFESEGELFSTKFGCPKCGYVLDELEPRIFSFNNPQGACEACSGLGTSTSFDEHKIVVNPAVGLSSGALAQWHSGHAYHYSMLESVASHYQFDLDTPFEQLPERIRNIVLYGSGSERIAMRYEGSNGRVYHSRRPFEGVINNLDRRLKESNSEAVKEELSKYLTAKPCEACEGSRLQLGPRNVFVNNLPIHKTTCLNIAAAIKLFDSMSYASQSAEVAARIVRDIRQRLQFLIDVGLTYVSLDRATNTLSGGELQRIRLASQVGSGLVGVTYVLDEPSIGLHDRDSQKLLNTLNRLRDLGNTLIVVEHDEKTIRNADYIVDLGPRAGAAGGEVISSGKLNEVIQCPQSLTGAYLSGKKSIAVPSHRNMPDHNRMLELEGARGNNLKNICVKVPLGLFTCVTGVSGSGKSTLVNETIYPAVANRLNRTRRNAAPYQNLYGLENIDKIVRIDQQPIGRTPRSNPATYTGLFDLIRGLFAKTVEARTRGYGPGRFSFNVRGGRCEACRGDGVVRVEMHFLPDMFVRCTTCNGSRYNRETLDIRYRGLSISDVLDLSVAEALELFGAVPAIAKKLEVLSRVGLDYIKLGQNAVTLSGGEAQRVKLSLELSKRDTGRTLYLLDEPTTGLHFEDIKQLLSVIHELRDRGNSIIVIEHNLEVLKTADWLIDLGPEGGDGGGQVVAEGTPEQVAANPHSHTGCCLLSVLQIPVTAGVT